MIKLVLTSAVLGGALASAAFAETCVSCSGPSAAYNCVVKKEDQIRALGGDKAISKVCVTVLRKKGAHASCEVSTGSCGGAATTIGWKEVKQALAAGLDDAESTPKAKTAAPPAQSAAPAKSDVPGKPEAKKVPATETARVQQAPVVAPADPAKPAVVPAEEPSLGEKLKSGAEKSWKCVASLFGEC